MEFLSESDLLDRTSIWTSTFIIFILFLILSLLLLLLHLHLEHTSQSIGLFSRLRRLLLFLFQLHLLLSWLGKVTVRFFGGCLGRSESPLKISCTIGIRGSRFSGGSCSVCVLFIHHHGRYVRRESCSQGLDHIKIWAQALMAELAVWLTYRTKRVLSQIGGFVGALNDEHVFGFFFFVDLLYQYLTLLPHVIEVFRGDSIKVKVFCRRLDFLSEAFNIDASGYGSVFILLFIVNCIRITSGSSSFLSVRIILLITNDLTAQGKPEVVIIRLFLKLLQHFILSWFLYPGGLAFSRVACLRALVGGEARVAAFVALTLCYGSLSRGGYVLCEE